MPPKKKKKQPLDGFIVDVITSEDRQHRGVTIRPKADSKLNHGEITYALFHAMCGMLDKISERNPEYAKRARKTFTAHLAGFDIADEVPAVPVEEIAPVNSELEGGGE